jgi:cobalt/nickel transport system permease protein
LKLLFGLALILTISLVPPGLWPVATDVPISLVHLGVALLLTLAIALSGIPWSYVLVRLAAMTPLVLFISLTVPISRGFEAGWHLMAGILAKGLLSFTVVLLLVNTTPFDRLLSAAGRLGVPQILVASASFMYRYQFVLLDELARMSRARQARTFRDSWLNETVAAARLIGPLLVRAFERAERVHRAMLARGFDGRVRTLD